jgi:hypothetical protein
MAGGVRSPFVAHPSPTSPLVSPFRPCKRVHHCMSRQTSTSPPHTRRDRHPNASTRCAPPHQRQHALRFASALLRLQPIVQFIRQLGPWWPCRRGPRQLRRVRSPPCPFRLVGERSARPPPPGQPYTRMRALMCTRINIVYTRRPVPPPCSGGGQAIDRGKQAPTRHVRAGDRP